MIPSTIADGIDAETYPVTTEQVLDRLGDSELQLQGGTEQLSEVLGRIDDETYDSADELRLAVLTGMSSNGVGRLHYSDRDPTPPGAPYGHEQLSF